MQLIFITFLYEVIMNYISLYRKYVNSLLSKLVVRISPLSKFGKKPKSLANLQTNICPSGRIKQFLFRNFNIHWPLCTMLLKICTSSPACLGTFHTFSIRSHVIACNQIDPAFLCQKAETQPINSTTTITSTHLQTTST